MYIFDLTKNAPLPSGSRQVLASDKYAPTHVNSRKLLQGIGSSSSNIPWDTLSTMMSNVLSSAIKQFQKGAGAAIQQLPLGANVTVSGPFDTTSSANSGLIGRLKSGLGVGNRGSCCACN